MEFTEGRGGTAGHQAEAYKVRHAAGTNACCWDQCMPGIPRSSVGPLSSASQPCPTAPTLLLIYLHLPVSHRAHCRCTVHRVVMLFSQANGLFGWMAPPHSRQALQGGRVGFPYTGACSCTVHHAAAWLLLGYALNCLCLHAVQCPECAEEEQACLLR